MKRAISLLLIFFMLISLLAGCESSIGSESTDNQQRSIPSSNVGNTNQLGNIDPDNSGDYNPVDADGIDWSKYDWDNFDEADLRVDIGKASFTVDNSASAIGDFMPGQPLSLSVTDSAGATWRLDIPSNGLLFAETITITALVDVTTDGPFGKLDGGLLMEPDGLMFFAPATLTVSGSGNWENSVMFMADHNGGNLALPGYDAGADSATMYISHFSTAFNGKNIDNYTAEEIKEAIEELTGKKLNKAQSAAAELLKQPIKPPSVEPPDAWFECCQDNVPGLDAFLKKFNEPEKSIIDKLWKDVDKFLDDFLSENKSPADVDLDKSQNEVRDFSANMLLTVELYKRLGQKANMLIDKYKYRPEKFFAVTYAASFPNVVFGVSEVNKAEVDKWWRETWNYHMKKLVEEHDFCKRSALDRITLVSAFAGAKVPKDWTEKIGNAMTFEPQFTVFAELDGGAMSVRATGEVKDLKMDKANEDEGFWWGEATGKARYTNFTVVGKATVDKPEYEFDAKLLRLDSCGSKTIQLGVKDFGPKTDYFYEMVSGLNRGQTSAYSFVSMFIAGAFAQRYFNAREEQYIFTLQLINGEELCAEEKFEGSDYDITLFLDLYHTPKGDMYY